jgi:uncharacterized protein YjiS (DUF1127 family)
MKITRLFAAYRGSRRTIVELRSMDDHILRDIGLTRADVMQAAATDFHMDRIGMLNRARARRTA